MAEPFATVQDVIARWRPLTSDEYLIAEVLLGDASLMVRAEFGDIDQRIASGALDPGAPLSVVCQMVRRSMQASSVPGGAKSLQESVGPMSFSVTYENAAGNLFLSAAERALLGGPNPVRAKSVQLAPGWMLR